MHTGKDGSVSKSVAIITPAWHLPAPVSLPPPTMLGNFTVSIPTSPVTILGGTIRYVEDSSCLGVQLGGTGTLGLHGARPCRRRCPHVYLGATLV